MGTTGERPAEMQTLSEPEWLSSVGKKVVLLLLAVSI